MKRVRRYIRVSHKDVERGISPEVQADEMDREQKQHTDWMLSGPDYVDDDHSAKTDKIEKRPAFQQLLEDARAKKFDVLLVYMYDRIARNLKIYFSTLSDLEDWGIEVKSATEPDDWLVKGFSGLVAAQFSRTLSVRMLAVRAYEKRQGLVQGQPPVGYTWIGPGLIAPQEPYASYMRFAFVDLYLTGQYGAGRIAQALNDRGWTNPDGSPFKKTQLDETLINPLYGGYIRHGDILRHGKFQAILEEDEFRHVQEMNKRRSLKRTRPTQQHHPLLHGLIVCASCGEPMWHTPSGTDRHYDCSAWKKKVPISSSGLACVGFRSLAEPLEQTVQALLAGVALTDDIEALAYRLVEQPHIPAIDPAALEQKLKRLDRVYVNGGLSDQEYDQQRAQVLKLLQEANQAPRKVDLTQALALLRDVPTLLHHATPVEQRIIIGELIDEVYVRKEEVLAIRPTQLGDHVFAAAAGSDEWLKKSRWWAGRGSNPRPSA